MTWVHDDGDGTVNPQKERDYPDLPPLAVPNVTTLDPATAAHDLAMLMSARGAILTTQGPGGLSGYFVVRNGPSVLMGLLLLLLCFVPGLLYLLLGGSTSTEPFSIGLTVTEHGTGTAVTGQGKGLAEARWAVTQLPQAVR